MRRRATGSTTSIQRYRAAGWRELSCERCNGTGAADGRRREQPMMVMQQCPRCRGYGSIWLSPSGRRAFSPGGEFLAG
jgi:DnaJ-class molecular chaperone